MRRELRFAPGCRDQIRGLHRFSHFRHQELPGFLVRAAFLDFPENAPDFLLVDLAVRLGRVDHGLQDELRISLQFRLFRFRLRRREPQRDPRRLAGSGFEGLESHGSEQGHDAAPQAAAQGTAQTSSGAHKRPGERAEPSQGEVLVTADHASGFVQDVAECAAQRAALGGSARSPAEHSAEAARQASALGASG